MIPPFVRSKILEQNLLGNAYKVVKPDRFMRLLKEELSDLPLRRPMDFYSLKKRGSIRSFHNL